jgi:transposase-like protein
LRPINDSYRVDETYVKVKGAWKYLYRAVDSTGQTIDFMLSAKWDTKAAKRFFRKMLKAPKHQSPRVINVDQNNVQHFCVSTYFLQHNRQSQSN